MKTHYFRRRVRPYWGPGGFGGAIRQFFFIAILMFFTQNILCKNVESLISVLSIDLQKVTIKDVFLYIENKSDYSFWVDTDIISLDDEVSVSLENKSVTQILDYVLKDRSLSYEIKGKHIIIKKQVTEQEETEVKKLMLQPIDNKYVKGRVIDAITQEPVIGANIVIKNTTTGVLSDVDGYFSIRMPNEKKELSLVISYIGYFTREILVKENQTIEVELEIKAEQLEEVQIVAYGAQKKVTITGAISSIDTKALVKSPSSSVGNILAGAVSGVSSVQVSGQPGAEDPEIFVRGTGSLSVDASRPLILVDGVERSFFQMDPNEIENVTVLKDASATAVFGVKGANGVILVTTKRGEKGKTSISVTSSAGLTHAIRHLSIVDSYRHALLYSETELNDNPLLKPEELTFTPFVTQMFKEGKDPLIFPSINWENYITKKYSWQTQHNVTLTGGTDRVRYFVSLGYMYQNGMLKRFEETYNPNYTYSRYNYRSNLDIDVTNTTLVKVNIGGRVGVTNEPKNSDLWRSIIWGQPFGGAGIVDGKYVKSSDYYIPLSKEDGLSRYYLYGYDKSTQNVLNFDITINQKLDFITKGLSAEVKAAYNTSYYFKKSRANNAQDNYVALYKGTIDDPTMSITDPSFDKTVVFRHLGAKDVLSYSESYGKDRDWYGEFSLRYNRQLGDHNVSGLLLYNQQKTYYPSVYTEIPTGYVGLVGRVTYDYKTRYMIDLNMGYNGSENFAPGLRYGFFPAASVGWVMTEEKWMKNQRILDYLKLRASYGLVGNDKFSGYRFLYLAGSFDPSTGSYGYNFGTTSTIQPGTIEKTLGNPDVTWETSAKQNYGVDIKTLDSRLSLSADFFYEKRRDILSQRKTIPSIIAVDLPLVNIGKVDNYGYELSLRWQDQVNKFNYWTGFNVSFARNEVKYFDEVEPNEPYMAQTGRPIGLNYGYIFDRFFSEDDFDANGKLKDDIPVHSVDAKPGDAMYKDLNHDNVIDSDDKTYFGYSVRPEYIFGLLGGFSWNNFDFSMQWTGATNVSRLLQVEYRTPFGTTNDRGLLEYMANERWTPETAETATMPRFTFANKVHNQQTSSLWLWDASYIRLKNVELGYNMALPGLKKLGIQSLRVFANGYNLLTFSKLKKLDIDPEGNTGNSYNYPNIQIFNLGFNVKF